MSWIRIGWRRARWVIFFGLGVLASGFLAIQHPAIFFKYSVTAHGWTLRSDRPFDPAAGERVLAEVRQRVDASPLSGHVFSSDICIANAAWRRRIFFTYNQQAIGMSFPTTRHVYISGANVSRGKVIAPAGFEVGSYFSLVYTICHELGHVQTYRHLGRIRTLTHLPVWIREGFAQYVGGIPGFDFDRERQAFLAGDPSMGPPRPGVQPYRRLHLLMTFLLEKRGWSVDRLFDECPDQAVVEGWLRDSVYRAQLFRPDFSITRPAG